MYSVKLKHGKPKENMLRIPHWKDEETHELFHSLPIHFETKYRIHLILVYEIIIDWRGERNTFYKVVKTSPLQTHFKNCEVDGIRNEPKWTIFTIGGLGL